MGGLLKIVQCCIYRPVITRWLLKKTEPWSQSHFTALPSLSIASIILFEFSCHLLHKSQNPPVSYPTMHHSVKEMCNMCAHFCYKMVHCGYLCNALWELWDRFIGPHHHIDVLYNYETVNFKPIEFQWKWPLLEIGSASVVTKWRTIFFCESNLSIYFHTFFSSVLYCHLKYNIVCQNTANNNNHMWNPKGDNTNFHFLETR